MTSSLFRTAVLANQKNRLLSKRTAVRKMRGEPERRTGVYTPVHEDSSIVSTQQFSTAVAFRKKSNKNLGMVCINLPPSYHGVGLGYGLLLLAIMIFCLKAHFAEKYIVKGYLTSTKGIVNVYASKPGIILENYSYQGAEVKQGSPLFKIDTSFTQAEFIGNVKLLKELKIRKTAIEEEISRKYQYLQNLRTLLNKKYIASNEVIREQEALDTLKMNLSVILLEIIKYQQEQAYILRAPIHGKVINNHYFKGQTVDISKPLLKIIPDQSQVIAELFIPVHQAGFLSKNQKIQLRYDAYPYQHFGSHAARIQEISQGIFTDAEEKKPLKIGEPYYRVIAVLENAVIKINGVNKMVQPGMTLSAVVMGPERKIWQWILEPFKG